jgi:hypothetical protein
MLQVPAPRNSASATRTAPSPNLKSEPVATCRAGRCVSASASLLETDAVILSVILNASFGAELGAPPVDTSIGGIEAGLTERARRHGPQRMRPSGRRARGRPQTPGIVLFTPKAHRDRTGTASCVTFWSADVEKTYGELKAKGIGCGLHPVAAAADSIVSVQASIIIGSSRNSFTV